MIRLRIPVSPYVGSRLLGQVRLFTFGRRFLYASERPHKSDRPAFLKSVNTLESPLYECEVSTFKERAFGPQEPILITRNPNSSEDVRISDSSDVAQSAGIPAIEKWFEIKASSAGTNHQYSLNIQYLYKFRNTILPYEYLSRPGPEERAQYKFIVTTLSKELAKEDSVHRSLDPSEYLPPSVEFLHGEEQRFLSFQAPFQLLIEASKRDSKRNILLPRLYIAQAQLRDLPAELQADLPTPSLVSCAGKGDIYDSNIWIGTPPTYTPLHKDPNPNLFVQLASTKVVRIFRPEVGRAIFHSIQKQLGGHGDEAFRGEEMMQGRERELLDAAVWKKPEYRGLEATVRPGDALFIPKGWWHSIKSVGEDINASVNWWFR